MTVMRAARVLSTPELLPAALLLRFDALGAWRLDFGDITHRVSLRSRNENGAMRLLENGLRDRANDQPIERTFSVRSNHDQIRTKIGSELQDLAVWLSGHEVRNDTQRTHPFCG